MKKGKIILTSFYPVYIMALNITTNVPGLRVENLTYPYTGCLHDYQLTTENMKALEKASIFIINGGGMESFLDKTLSIRPDLQIIDSSAGVPQLKDPASGAVNPHFWLSVTNAILQVRNISGKLSELDPGNKNRYLKNAADYIRKLEALRQFMKKELAGISNQAVVTFHEAFPYFAVETGLQIAAVIEREPGSEPTAKELRDTIRIIQQKKVRAIFVEPQYSTKSADTISGETGTAVYTLDPAVTGPFEPEAYLKIMVKNTRVLKDALK